MKKHLLKTLFLCLFALVGTTAFAYDCEVDGIYYNLNTTNQTASVTYLSDFNRGRVYSGVVHIPEKVVYDGITYSVTSIGDQAFYGCSSLTAVTIPNSITTIGITAFGACSRLTELAIPNSVTSIGDSAFSGCSGLTELTIPNSVITIGFYAFYDCRRLTELTIPNSVTSIGEYAFENCYNLISVTSLNTTPPTTDYYTFDYNTHYRYATLHVPAGCKKAYAQAEGWKNFLNILEDAVDGIAPVVAGQQAKPAAIYTIDGVKQNATSLRDLPGGIYIVNGKKVVIK